MSMQDYLVLGLGVTGISVIRYFNRKGYKPYVADTKLKQAAILTILAEHNLDAIVAVKPKLLLDQLIGVVVSPGVPLSNSLLIDAKAANVAVIGDIELFAQEVRQSHIKLLAVTGSNGKTTVVKLIEQALLASGKKTLALGNIGVGVLDVLVNLEHYDFLVLELSSFQLDLLQALVCDWSCITNITPDHMDRYASFAQYRAAKIKIHLASKMPVINMQDQEQQLSLDQDFIAVGANIKDRLSLFIRSDYIYLNAVKLCPLSSFKLQGEHNYYNFMFVLAAVVNFKLPVQPVLAVLQQFSGIEHRCQHVATIKGVRYINDSKATNVGATIAALVSFQPLHKIVLIAGGDAKGADLTKLKSFLQEVAAVIVFGKDCQKFTALCKQAYIVASMQEAIDQAVKLVATDGVVLLSPACSSLDMYENFAIRGLDFSNRVNALC